MDEKWLIPIDGSASSLHAVEYVAKEAAQRERRPQLFLVNVQAPLSSDITRFVHGKDIEAFHREAGEAALAAARAKLDAAGLAYSSHILVGEAAPSLVAFAKEKQCTLIIMGARGLGSVVGLFMGSVTTKVVHLAETPVLLVK
jgi:nucleotide-binding universal stress UspA family protein